MELVYASSSNSQRCVLISITMTKIKRRIWAKAFPLTDSRTLESKLVETKISIQGRLTPICSTLRELNNDGCEEELLDSCYYTEISSSTFASLFVTYRSWNSWILPCQPTLVSRSCAKSKLKPWQDVDVDERVNFDLLLLLLYKCHAH